MHHDPSVLKGFSLVIIRTATAGHRERRGFNEDGQTSQKPITAFISVLELSMVLIVQNELPPPNERRSREGGRREWKRKRLKGEVWEEFCAFPPSGRSVCWWSAASFSGKRIFCLPPKQASLTEWSPSGGAPSSSHRVPRQHTSS